MLRDVFVHSLVTVVLGAIDNQNKKNETRSLHAAALHLKNKKQIETRHNRRRNVHVQTKRFADKTKIRCVTHAALFVIIIDFIFVISISESPAASQSPVIVSATPRIRRR